MAILTGINADAYLSATPSIATTNETCDNTDSGVWVTYQAHTHKYWDQTQTFTVQCSPNGSGSWSTVTDYTVQWAGGNITFNTARTAGVNNFVRISAGSYFNVSQIGYSNKWQLDTRAEQADVTVFGSSGGFHVRAGTLKVASAKVNTFTVDNTFFPLLGNLAVLVLYMTSPIRMEMYAYLTQESIQAIVNNVDVAELGFEVTGPVYYRTT